MITLNELWVYPVKSLKGISLTESQLSDRGLLHDRRWMLVDKQGNFMSQREIAKMALIETELGDNRLTIKHLAMPTIQIPIELYFSSKQRKQVVIWDDSCEAFLVGEEADYWFSEFLGQECHLVFMPEESQRKIDANYDFENRNTSLSDGFPYLLISQASLDDLNSRLEKPVPMNRFRPNFVVGGTEAFAEDQWKVIKIGNNIFDVAKPCARCQVTTINQITAEQGKEPLATLAKYRRVENKVLFGQNLIQREINGIHHIHKGDVVEILETK